MFAWRAQIGVIAPAVCPHIERDFGRFAPEGVGVSTNRIQFSGKPTVEGLKNMVDCLEDSAKIFEMTEQDCVVFGCTSGSLIGGLGFDVQCSQTIEKACGWPGLTTSTTVLEAFKKLGVNRAAVLTPYPDETNQLEKQFLEANGIGVTTIVGMTPPGGDIIQITPQMVYRYVKQLDLTGADSIFISCTGLNVLDIIHILETDFGLPVITSNQATLWGALRHARVGEKMPYLGKLFTL